MASVQIKNVPDDVRAELHRRAGLAGQSLQEYLLARLINDARSPSLDDVLARASGRQGGTAPFDEVVALLREDRDTK